MKRFLDVRNRAIILVVVGCCFMAGTVSANHGHGGGDNTVEICVRSPLHPDGRTVEVSRFFALLLKKFFPARVTFGACDADSCTRNRDCTQPDDACQEAICVRGECQTDDALECPTLDPCTVGMCVDNDGVAECQFTPKMCDAGETCDPDFGLCVGDRGIGRTVRAALTYIYGLAPVIVAKTQHDQINSTKNEATYAPINRLYINTQVSTPDNQLFVSPNPNVVYASSHMDLSKGPMALFTPSSGARYYVWQIMDAYTNNFEYIGTRNTNGAVANYVFVGPDFKGRVPRGFVRIDCPDNNMWMVGRFEADSEDPRDVKKAIRLIQRNVFLPLRRFQNRPPGFKNPIIRKPIRTVPELNIDGLNFFTVLNEWLTANPPPRIQDRRILRRMARIGVGPGMTTDFENLPPDQQQDLLEGMEIGFRLVQAETFLATTNFGGYRAIIGPELGTYRTQYLLRSAAARGGLGVNSNVEALYPLAVTTAAFLPLRGGENTYQSRFTADMLPVPVNAFWSITAYDRSTGRLIDNPIDRYTIGSQNELFVADDGSITIHMQSTDPGGNKTANWLPTMADADGKFYLILRAYFPDPVMYTPEPPDGPDYIVPALRRTFRRD